MAYQWDRIVGAIVWGRSRAAMVFGLPPEELKAIGRAAAVEADRSWRSDGGRKRDSWVYLNVEIAVRRALTEAGRYASEYDPYLCEPDDVETRCLIREALNYLEARLPRDDWVMLWLNHAEGRNCAELAGLWGISHAAMRQRISRARIKAVTLCRQFA
jgi:DNA-directed RNA polymerase specialized sigma24 family protein